jgi:hypothetical protein
MGALKIEFNSLIPKELLHPPNEPGWSGLKDYNPMPAAFLLCPEPESIASSM